MERQRSHRYGGDLPSQHGPAAWFLLSVGLSAMVFAGLAAVAPDPPMRFLLLGMCVLLLAASVPGLAWFTADEHGVTRRTLFGRRTFRWDEIGGGSANEVDGVLIDGNLLPVRPYWTVVCAVWGRNGRVLFRIGLPVRERGHLLRLIRRETRLRAAGTAPAAPGI